MRKITHFEKKKKKQFCCRNSFDVEGLHITRSSLSSLNKVLAGVPLVFYLFIYFFIASYWLSFFIYDPSVKLFTIKNRYFTCDSQSQSIFLCIFSIKLLKHIFRGHRNRSASNIINPQQFVVCWPSISYFSVHL